MDIQAKVQDINHIQSIRDIQNKVQLARKRRFKDRIISLKETNDREKKRIKTEVRNNVWDSINTAEEQPQVTNPRTIVKEQFKSNINNN